MLIASNYLASNSSIKVDNVFSDMMYFSRQAMIQTCRHFKDHFREARERSSKALGFAKMLRKVKLKMFLLFFIRIVIFIRDAVDVWHKLCANSFNHFCVG